MSDSGNISVRALPAVEAVLMTSAGRNLVAVYGHTIVADTVRELLNGLRSALAAGKPPHVGLNPDAIAAEVQTILAGRTKRRIRSAVNATGIVLHTGLGRARMPDVARDALADVAGYCNLQLEIESGKRGRREANVLDVVKELTGAEDACVVNNNAGATMLVLKALAEGSEVIVSRGELIEIGGSFRLPDIMKESGAILREVGTTNKTHPRDYEEAIGAKTGLLFKAHKSNYRVVGFSADVDIATIAAIGRKRGIAVVDDLGAGALVGLEQYGLPHETTVRESLAAGADVALFSTDKLIGGPQGGLIVGREPLITKIRKHPLYRVLRVCKLTLAALEATLGIFRTPELLTAKHPLYFMLARTPEQLRKAAEDLAAQISAKRRDFHVTVVPTVSFLGGGSLPGEEMPSFAVKISGSSVSADELARRLRESETPVISRIEDDCVILDLRTILPGDATAILSAC